MGLKSLVFLQRKIELYPTNQYAAGKLWESLARRLIPQTQQTDRADVTVTLFHLSGNFYQ